jgi:hypothetical protein
VRISPRTAAVLGRAGALARHTDRVARARLGGEHLLHHDLMLPVVTEVVGGEGSATFAWEQVTKRRVALVPEPQLRIWDPVSGPTISEDVHVAGSPSPSQPAAKPPQRQLAQRHRLPVAEADSAQLLQHPNACRTSRSLTPGRQLLVGRIVEHISGGTPSC